MSVCLSLGWTLWQLLPLLLLLILPFRPSKEKSREAAMEAMLARLVFRSNVCAACLSPVEAINSQWSKQVVSQYRCLFHGLSTSRCNLYLLQLQNLGSINVIMFAYFFVSACACVVVCVLDFVSLPL